MVHTKGGIRELIDKALTDKDLKNLCSDEFGTVYDDFDGQTRSTNIRSLVDYVFRQDKIDKLLEGIKEINSHTYNEYLNRIGAEIDRPQAPPAIVTTSPKTSIDPTKCILMLAANPTGTEELDLKAEANKIAARLQEGTPGKDYFIRFMELK